MVNGPEAAPSKMAAPATQPTFNYMQTGRSLESSQIQDCSSGKLSKAFHTSTATVTAVRRELCFRKAKNLYIGSRLPIRNDPGRFRSPHANVLGRLVPNGLPKGKKADTRPLVDLTNEAQHVETHEVSV